MDPGLISILMSAHLTKLRRIKIHILNLSFWHSGLLFCRISIWGVKATLEQMPAAERVSKQLSGGWRLQRPGHRPRCPSEEVRGYTVTAAPCNYIPELIGYWTKNQQNNQAQMVWRLMTEEWPLFVGSEERRCGKFWLRGGGVGGRRRVVRTRSQQWQLQIGTGPSPGSGHLWRRWLHLYCHPILGSVTTRAPCNHYFDISFAAAGLLLLPRVL